MRCTCTQLPHSPLPNTRRPNTQAIREGRQDLQAWLTSKGVTAGEGFVSPAQEMFFRRLLASKPDIRNVMEIGFNAGHSACVFLSCRDDVRVTSFDLGEHASVAAGKAFVDSRYGAHRHRLVLGPSARTVPTHAAEAPDGASTFDLVFIDGSHDYADARADIRHALQFAHANTVVVVYDTIPELYWGKVPTQAWHHALADGEVKQVEVVSDPTAEPPRAWVVGTFVVRESEKVDAARTGSQCLVANNENVECKAEAAAEAVDREMEGRGNGTLGSTSEMSEVDEDSSAAFMSRVMMQSRETMDRYRRELEKEHVVHVDAQNKAAGEGVATSSVAARVASSNVGASRPLAGGNSATVSIAIQDAIEDHGGDTAQQPPAPLTAAERTELQRLGLFPDDISDAEATPGWDDALRRLRGLPPIKTCAAPGTRRLDQRIQDTVAFMGVRLGAGTEGVSGGEEKRGANEGSGADAAGPLAEEAEAPWQLEQLKDHIMQTLYVG